MFCSIVIDIESSPLLIRVHDAYPKHDSSSIKTKNLIRNKAYAPIGLELFSDRDSIFGSPRIAPISRKSLLAECSAPSTIQVGNLTA